MASVITQTEFDNTLEVFFLNKVKFAEKVATLKRQDDPAAFNKEEYLMMFDNIMYALRDYDVTSELLEDDEIEYLFELGTQISLNWPM